VKILQCASEVNPFVKTGGLADVVGALSFELSRRGHDVRIVLPLHGSIDRHKWPIRRVIDSMGVPLGYGEKWCSVYETTLPQSSAPVFLIEHDQYFGRSALYQWDGEDYDDNAERFAFFSRACCQLVKALHWSPDVIHAHDWQTALIPVYLKSWEADHPRLWSTASVQSIHNLGYQGVFPKDQILHSQLGWEHFHTGSLEFYDQINYLKAGILFADKVSTVSPTYAHEIQTPEHGWALDGVLRSRSPDLVGILNGCEYGEWDPSRDSRIPVQFDVDQPGGKKICKEELQRSFGLPIRPDVPIVGLVTRLAYQKGIDILASAIPSMMSMDMQLVVLGAGEVWAHFYYGGLPSSYPGKVGSYIGYDDVRAHLIMAGSDFLLVPSRYEPCGLTQLQALRYGTLPIVRSTGGLNDTVDQYDESTGGGDGFRFHDLSPRAIADTVGWGVSTYFDRPHHFAAMRDRAMRKRFLWSTGAEQYEHLFRWAIERKRGHYSPE
jgi:starch synthase